MQGVLKTNDGSFARDVLAAPGVVLVEFGARWCPPCRRMAPVLDGLARDGATVVEVDSDECPGLANRYGVRAMPTFIVFKAGTPVASFTGAQAEAVLATALQEAATAA